MTGQIHVINGIGMRLSVNVDSPDAAFAVMRQLGKAGFLPIEVPAGGFRLPYAMHPLFDWSLIGARPGELDGDKGVWFGGLFYKLRDYPAQTTGKKMGAKIKYSRGAKPTDDPRVVEKGTGDDSYVTLITFSGGGLADNRLIQSARSTTGALESKAENAAPAAHDDGDAPITREQHQAIIQYAGAHGFTDKRLADCVKAASGQLRVGDLKQKHLDALRKLMSDEVKARKVPA